MLSLLISYSILLKISYIDYLPRQLKFISIPVLFYNFIWALLISFNVNYNYGTVKFNKIYWFNSDIKVLIL